MAALGAMAAAVLAVGVKATEMAAEVDTALRRVTQKVPGAQAAFESLKGVARELSIEFGLAQTEVIGVMDAIAEGGISSAEDLEEATRAVVLAQKASGKEFTVLVQALDTSLDAFGLSAKDSQVILADLLATAKGSTNIGDLSEVLKKVGPAAKAAGVDFQTTIAAIAAMQTKVTDTKGQVTLFKGVLENEGVAGLNKYADAVRPVGDALNAMKAAAEQNGNSAENLQKRIKETLNAELIDLGARILPMVITGLQGVLALFDIISGKAAGAKFNTAVDELGKLGTSIAAFTGEQQKNALILITTQMDNLVKGAGGWGKLGDAIGTVGGPRLAALKAGLDAALDSGELSTTQTIRFKEALKQVDDRIAKGGLKVLAADTKAVGTATGSALPPLKDYAALTKATAEAEKDAAAERKILADRTATLNEINVILADETGRFLSNAKSAIKKLGDEMLAAGGTIAGVSGLIDPLLKKVEALEKKKVKEPFKAAFDTVEALNVELDKAATNVGDVLDHGEKLKTPFSLVKDEVIGIAFAALDAAEHFGIISGEAFTALGHIIDLADQLDDISKIKDPLGAGFGQLLSGLSGIIGSLTGILGTVFGESPADKERKRILQENTARLRELTTVTGDLVDVQSSGRKIAGVGAAITSFFKPGGGSIEQALGKQGLNLSDLDAVAKDFGITIRGKDGKLNAAGVAQLLQAIQNADTGAANTFAGKVGTLDTGLRIGSIAKGSEFGNLLAAAGPDNAITKLLSQFDVSKASGRADATTGLGALFGDLASGKLKLADLGGLSRKEFQALIERLVGILNSDQEITPFNIAPGSGPGVSGDTPIVSIDDGIGNLNDLTVQSNAYLDGILRTLQSFSPFAAPSLPGAAAGSPGAGGLVFSGNINLTINGAPGQSEQAIADAVIETIDRYLAVRQQAAQSVLGSAVRAA